MKWRNRVIHAGVLVLVFLIAVAAFGYLTNKKNSNMTTDMGAATRPQVAFSYNGYSLNDLPGYKNEMDITGVRDSITPVSNGQLQVTLKAYENVIDSLDYIVYSLDGKDKLLEKKVKKPGENVALDVESADGENILSEERMLQITLHMDSYDMYYYTRIIDGSKLNAAQCLDYVQSFHENALAKAEGVGIGTAIEPSDEGDNTTLQHVTIHSDYTHVTWGNLAPKVNGSERWTIKELNSTYMAVELEYRVNCTGEENEQDEYQVREYFRVRYISGSQKAYLLDYDRTMDQIFDATKKVLNEKGVLLGITDKNPAYMVNKNGTIVSFVQAGELWNYNRDKDEVSLVFSFADAENTDVRNMLGQHDIKILNVDKNGNTTFAVCGYMNRGSHEGETGAAIYYYNIEQNSVEEKLFVSSDKAYDRAQEEVSGLVYYNVGNGCLYTIADDILYKMDMKKGTKKELATGLNEDQYVASDDGHLVAYEKDDPSKSKSVTVMNLETGKEYEVNCGDDECIKPLGFMDGDFVYGVARTAEVGTTLSGAQVIPMYKVEITSGKDKVIKTYEQSGIYVLGATFETNLITLDRAVKDGEAYAGTAQDYITSNKEAKESNIYAQTYVTDLKETQVRLTYDDGISDKEPKLLKPKQVVLENVAEVSLDRKKDENAFYVYGHGQLQGTYNTAGKAIQKADNCGGVVVDADQNYIWERGNRDLKYSIDTEDAETEQLRQTLAGGKSTVDAITEVYGNVMDLSGCTIDELLYNVNQGHPVIAILDAQTTLMVVGYGEETVTCEDIASGARSNRAQSDFANVSVYLAAK